MAILQQIKVPLISVNDTSLTVVELSFANGDRVNKGDNILVFETSKTTYNVEAEADGFIQYDCEQGNDYDVNDIVAKIVSEESEVIQKAVTKKTNAPAAPSAVVANTVVAVWEGDTLFSLAAIELITAKGIDRSVFKGRDFVSGADVEDILGINRKTKIVDAPASKTTAKAKPGLPVDMEKVIVEKLSSNKKREIEFLSEVQSTGLTSTINTTVETEGIFVHVNRSLKMLKNSLLPVIIYEVARLLEKYKELNAYFTGDAIAQYKQVNIGFAIDIDKGLKVLKIANTSQKNMSQVEEEIMELSGKYLDDNLQFDDLVDVSFTITDLSSEGVSFFRPLVNMMNSAILGVSSIDEKLNRCILSVTFDHRVTEGKRVAQFLSELKLRLESYRSKYHSHVNQDISCFKCYKSLKDDLSDVGFAKRITPAGEERLHLPELFKRILSDGRKNKEIISLYTKIPAAQINAQTIIDRSAVASSILLHRMYAGLQQEGFTVDNYWEVKNYGTLLQRINSTGNTPTVTVTELPFQHTIPFLGNESAGGEAGVGIDVEAVASMPVVSDFREDEFYTMNFTGAEIAYCILQPSSLASFAGLFAAKEAIVKADNSYQNKPFNIISIDHLPGGKPVCPGFQLSISHTKELAIAVAVRATTSGPLLSSPVKEMPSPAYGSVSLWLAIFAAISSAIAIILLLLYKS